MKLSSLTKLWSASLPNTRSRSRTCALTLGLSACLLASACGNDDPKRNFDSGVDNTKPASTLNDDDKHTFCRTLDAHVDVTVGFEEIARLLCLPRALLTSSRQACEEFLDTCMKQAPSPITVSATTSREQACFDDLDSCEANVGTLESCVNVNVGVVRQLLENISCTRFGDQTVGQDLTRAMQTAGTCAKASASCGAATQILL